MEQSNIIIPDFQKDDYLRTDTPFEWLYQFKDNKLQMQQLMAIMRDNAGAIGVKNFVTLFKAYLETLNFKNGIKIENTTDFTGQELELVCGEWYADDMGVTSVDKMGFEIIACNHPIMPIQRLVNVDSGIEKIKLAYRKNKQWRNIIADKKTLASNNAIIQLADYGIAVNSENSKHLVRYLTDIEHLNYDRIEELNSVSRLGWIDEYGFSPYVDNLVFDGEISFKHFFESVKTHGSFDKWLELCKEIRQNGIIAKIMLAASFASVLLKPCGALPFFVHLWGGTETGKTVSLILAASVWANPEMGKFIHTFNGTSVSQELSAGFVNSLPLILDELQIIKDKKDFDNLIYFLCEGIGRGRGQKTGGLQKLQSWQNCFLTTGENPISNTSSGGGAVNRVIEINCKEEKIFKNPALVADTLKKNYGYAGKMFIEKLSDPQNMEHAKAIQKDLYKYLSRGEVTEKQAAAASIILTADRLINEWIFQDNQVISTDDMKAFLFSISQVSANERALNYIYDIVSMNNSKFKKDGKGEYKGDTWGDTDDEYIYIIKSQFDKIMREEGFNSTAFLSWAAEKDIISKSQGKHTKVKRINGTVIRCVWLKVRTEQDFKDDFVEIEQTEDLPF